MWEDLQKPSIFCEIPEIISFDNRIVNETLINLLIRVLSHYAQTEDE